jgi:large subunit ribosomal protein L3
MVIGLVGRKCGMTRAFTEDGASIPVTVIQALPNRITRVRSADEDGYSALQVTTGTKKLSRVNKADAGQFGSVGAEVGEGLWEFRISAENAAQYEVGAELTVEGFQEGQIVDVAGTSIGKGFAGVIKRHNFSMQDATHGNSLAHRAPGSIGQNQTPGRVFKGKKMAGHLGNVRRTVQNIEVVRVDSARNLILVKGSVPGHKGGRVFIKPGVKADLPPPLAPKDEAQGEQS